MKINREDFSNREWTRIRKSIRVTSRPFAVVFPGPDFNFTVIARLVLISLPVTSIGLSGYEGKISRKGAKTDFSTE
jgi:hypothetical protein